MNKVLIKTDRLTIRSFEKKDANGLFDLLSNPRVNCFVDEKTETLKEAYNHIAQADSEYDFAVTLKDSDTFIGTLFGMKEEPDTFSPCWNFLPEYCRQGYAFESVTAYFNYLFYEKQIRRIYAYTEDYNLASQKLCRKLGMRQEGSFKEFISFVNNPDGTPKYENTLQFAILRSEWTENCHDIRSETAVLKSKL